MDSFNIKMMLQQAKWWPILTIIKLCLILYLVYKLLKFMKGYVPSLGILQPCSESGINTNLLYLYLLISHLKKSTSECPKLCAAFQTLIGFCRLYGKDGLFIGNILFTPIVIFFKAQAVEAVLGCTEHIGKGRAYRFMRPCLGTGLVTSQGTKWRKHRKLLTPTFHFSILEECIPVFQEQANILISKIKSQIQEPWVDITPLLSLCTLDIICQTAMGVSMNIQRGGNCDYSNAILELEETFMYRFLSPWLYPDIIFNLTRLGKKFNSNLRLVHELRRKVLKQKMDKMTKEDYNSTFDNKSNKCSFEKKIRKPFLELLLEYHVKDPSFTEKNVSEEVDTFMSAGHDTTAKAMSWVLYCLGIYPEVQRQVHEELDAIFTNEKNENISREVLSKMKYLESVIKETLRLYPVVPMVARETNQAFKVCQKFAMMETKTVLACILRHFRVKSLDPRDKVLIYPKITLGNAHPLRLSFERR